MSQASEAQRFWDELVSASPRRTHFALEHVLEAFHRTFPYRTGDADSRCVLERLLAELEQSGVLSLPRKTNRRAYDHSERTPLPKRIVRLDRPRSTLREAIVWRPELAFARDLGESLKEELLAIQKWLRNMGPSTPLIALRERSVEIFGDEKRLDALLGTQLFARGRLTLDVLRCYLPSVPIYLVTLPQDNANRRPLLVVENHTTFDTLCRWNEQHGRYAAVAFGAGAAFVAACESLRSHLSSPDCSGQLLYFGDLDPKGIWIPARAAQASGIEVFPEKILYDVLLSKGLKNQMLPRLQFSFDPTLLDWLPLSLRPETYRQFMAGRRLPQELISFCDLK